LSVNGCALKFTIAKDLHDEAGGYYDSLAVGSGEDLKTRGAGGKAG